MTEIKALVMDVDGTLTDGKINISADGELYKSFDVKDGYAIKNMLPENEIIPIILTARESEIVKKRCEELDIKYCFRGVQNKLKYLEKLMITITDDTGIYLDWNNIAYIGDDIPDLACMKKILSHGGIVGCPSDSVKEVIDVASFVSQKCGGSGAVRDFISWILTSRLEV